MTGESQLFLQSVSPEERNWGKFSILLIRLRQEK